MERAEKQSYPKLKRIKLCILRLSKYNASYLVLVYFPKYSNDSFQNIFSLSRSKTAGQLRLYLVLSLNTFTKNAKKPLERSFLNT